MATITLSVQRDTLKKIISGEETEHVRDQNDEMIRLFMNLPEDDGKMSDEEYSKLVSLKTNKEVEAIVFQLGRNPKDGFAIVQVKDIQLKQEVDAMDKPTGIYSFYIYLGRVLKHSDN